MDVKGVNRRDIEAKLPTMGDYVKIDYLTRCLKQPLDFDTKKYVLVNLAKIYESRGMFAEAGRSIKIAADINTTFDGKVADFMKSTELFVKAADYHEADGSFSKAIATASERQKPELKARIKEWYKMHALEYVKKDKRRNAMAAYEKFLTLEYITPDERKQAQQALLPLYEKLGRVREYTNLKNIMK